MISKKHFISIGLALLIFIFGLFPNAVLQYYSAGLYPFIARILRAVSGLFPFALGDILYACLLFFALIKSYLYFKKRKSLPKTNPFAIPLQLFHILLVLYITFKILWGLNYSRPSISTQLGVGNAKYTVKELVILGNFFIDRLNDLQSKTGPQQNYTLAALREQATLAYQQMALQNPLFNYPAVSLKPALNSWAISEIGIEGYYNPLSGEANINQKLPSWVLPFVVCHEIAHQLGVAREDEANLVGYLTAVHSKDLHFQYSANYNMLRYVLYEIGFKSPKDYELLYKKLNPQLIANFKAESEFWRQYNSQMSSYMTIAFDKFLKLNNQPQGIESYQNIVIWLWNYHKAEVLTK
ncbi:MAG: DUF3810 domain-containing protein [Bacteroidota bacterium]